ncbi:MAG: hypothetical protein KJZ47_02980 [Gemmatimonadales bacterium]|nr:hypothetical protein [Gemmatimonadales bacterium]
MPGRAEVLAAVTDETYGEERARRLRALLRHLAERILEAERTDRLLADAPELMRLLGEARSELFAWEVRSTYDTPEIAESRRIVEEAGAPPEFHPTDPEDDEPWRNSSNSSPD